jgi:6-phosphogluconolactonase
VRADVQVVEDPAEEAAQRLVAASGHVVLTGGSTPRRAYGRAAELRYDWSGVTLWFSDERCVSPHHEHSNYRMVKETMLDVVTGAEVHRMEAEKGPEEGADAYANELGAVFGYELPEVDLMLLGIGPDAHLCSLFPDAPALEERERAVVGVEHAGMAPFVSRVTLTLPVVNAARQLVFLVTGEEKAQAVARAVEGEPDRSAPASLVENERAMLICDEAAAGLLA